jgi:hypothetical protein
MEIIFKSERTLVVELDGIVHFISTIPGRHKRAFHQTLIINGSCCLMDGPRSIPDAAEALAKVSVWALRRDRLAKTNDEGKTS